MSLVPSGSNSLNAAAPSAQRPIHSSPYIRYRAARYRHLGTCPLCRAKNGRQQLLGRRQPARHGGERGASAVASARPCGFWLLRKTEFTSLVLAVPWHAHFLQKMSNLTNGGARNSKTRQIASSSPTMVNIRTGNAASESSSVARRSTSAASLVGLPAQRALNLAVRVLNGHGKNGRGHFRRSPRSRMRRRVNRRPEIILGDGNRVFG